MIPRFLDKSSLSRKKGVYIFKNSQGQILYVGKAVDLYRRVASYFRGDVDVKTTTLASSIAKVETIIVESELEALILEANLIKRNKPFFNVRLMDDKDYLYIGITLEDFPKVITARKKELLIMKKFWGPFPSSATVKNTLKMLRRVFPWCSNPPKSSLQPRGLSSKFRPCFYYHLGLCPGACVGLISKENYNKMVKRFCKFLEGKKDELAAEIFKEMEEASDNQKYEQAAKLKKMLEGIYYLTQENRTQLYLENPNFLEQERNRSLIELQKDLNLPKLPERIEGYDISNTQGKQAVGSMVVLTNGEIDKSQYRKFKIQTLGKPNDVGMHREMMRRRLKHKEWPYPDLIIIDGGRGQVRGAKLEIDNLKIAVWGLAKRREWLYPPWGEIVKLPRRSLSLRLLQKLRDESHRFAISYHRKLRDMIR